MSLTLDGPRYLGARGAEPSHDDHITICFSGTDKVVFAPLIKSPTFQELSFPTDIDMAFKKQRSRTISVRLSEEEYVAFRVLCATKGARSVSDLTRDAMRALSLETQDDVAHRPYMREVQTEMKRLSRKIELLTAEISTLRNGSDQ